MRINVFKYELYLLMKNKTLIVSVLVLFLSLLGPLPPTLFHIRRIR